MNQKTRSRSPNQGSFIPTSILKIQTIPLAERKSKSPKSKSPINLSSPKSKFIKIPPSISYSLELRELIAHTYYYIRFHFKYLTSTESSKVSLKSICIPSSDNSVELAVSQTWLPLNEYLSIIQSHLDHFLTDVSSLSQLPSIASFDGEFDGDAYNLDRFVHSLFQSPKKVTPHSLFFKSLLNLPNLSSLSSEMNPLIINPYNPDVSFCLYKYLLDLIDEFYTDNVLFILLNYLYSLPQTSSVFKTSNLIFIFHELLSDFAIHRPPRLFIELNKGNNVKLQSSVSNFGSFLSTLVRVKPALPHPKLTIHRSLATCFDFLHLVPCYFISLDSLDLRNPPDLFWMTYSTSQKSDPALKSLNKCRTCSDNSFGPHSISFFVPLSDTVIKLESLSQLFSVLFSSKNNKYPLCIILYTCCFLTDPAKLQNSIKLSSIHENLIVWNEHYCLPMNFFSCHNLTSFQFNSILDQEYLKSFLYNSRHISTSLIIP